MLASSAEDILLWDIRLPLEQQQPLKKEEDEGEINNSCSSSSTFPGSSASTTTPLQPAKRWTPPSSLVVSASPTWTNIHDLSWSHSANTISCAPSKFGGIVFCSVDQDGNRPQSKKGIIGHRCVDIGEKDRLLATAGQDSSFYLYSMSRCKLWHEFKCHNGNVTAVVFNPNSSHIASGSEKGEIILTNISTKESSAPLLAPRVQVINKLCYNPYKTSILGAVSSDGAVNIWDAGRAKLLHSANQVHTASATGLAYFTDNHQLLVTVGLDGKLALFDNTNLSPVSITSLKSGITCVDVGGDVIALGTKQGAIYLYDYRYMKTPFIHKEAAHKSAVNCIKFRKLEDKLLSLNQSLGNLSQTNSSGFRNSSKSNLGISDVGLELSPLRNKNIGINFEENGLFSPESQHNSLCHSDPSLNQSGMSNTNLSDFSPWPSMMDHTTHLDTSITNSALIDESVANYARLSTEEKNCPSGACTPQELRKAPDVRSNLQVADLPPMGGGISPKSPPSPQLPPAVPCQSPAIRQPQTSPHTQDMAAALLPGSDRNHQNSQSVMFSKQSISGSKSVPNFSKSPSSTEDAVPNANLRTSHMQVYPSLTNTNPLGNSTNSTNSGVSSTTVTQSTNDFSCKLVHSVVQDAMEGFADQIHNDFICMQMNVLRMFNEQRAELRYDMQQQLSVVKDLLAENQLLKQENKQLRKNLFREA